MANARGRLARLGPQQARFTLYGTLFGLLFPCMATVVALWAEGHLHWGGILRVHTQNPLLPIIDTAPFWLGLIASFAGGRQDALNVTLAHLERTNLRVETTNAMLAAINVEILERLQTTNAMLEAQNTRLEDQNQDLLRMGTVKDRFLANMSHEIRTPLTALLGFAELLVDPDLSVQEKAHYSDTIRRNGDLLLAIIDNVLDLSKIETGTLSTDESDCSPAGIISEAATVIRQGALAKGLTFDVRLATPIPATIRTDPTRLRQILLNLMGNALKFTNTGSIDVTVSYQPDEGQTLAIAVTDTGIGMTAEQVAGLFQPFHQVDPSTIRRFGGTGLGLAICRHLTVALAGDIAVTSEPGGGSTFRLNLPVVLGKDDRMIDRLDEQPIAATPTPAPPIQQLHGSVLLSEDGEDNQVLIRSILTKRGLSVVVAENGALAVEEALSALQAGKPFDVILMDMQMPVMDGYGATTALRAQGYAGPIIALTAHAMAGERERCLLAGCDEFVTKPVERAALMAVVAHYLPAGLAS